MSNEKKIMDLIPEELRPQLIAEVKELLEKQKQEEEKKKKADAEYIKKIVNML